MIAFAGARVLNHLLDQQPSLRERLAAHAGARIEFRTPPLPTARFAIEPGGHLRADDTGEAELVVTLAPFALPLLAVRSADAMEHVRMAGPQPLAEAARALLLELRWDVEEDLSRVVGDVAAHRMVEAGRDAARWQRDAGERLARNFSEYWSEENALLARRGDFEALARDIEALRASLDRLEARLGQAPNA